MERLGRISAACFLLPSLALALRPNYELLTPPVEADGKDVGLAADLAVLHVLLKQTRGLIDIGPVPLSAIVALKVALHGGLPYLQLSATEASS
jgi:hypothetical protein